MDPSTSAEQIYKQVHAQCREAFEQWCIAKRADTELKQSDANLVSCRSHHKDLALKAQEKPSEEEISKNIRNVRRRLQRQIKDGKASLTPEIEKSLNAAEDALGNAKTHTANSENEYRNHLREYQGTTKLPSEINKANISSYYRKIKGHVEPNAANAVSHAEDAKQALIKRLASYNHQAQLHGTIPQAAVSEAYDDLANGIELGVTVHTLGPFEADFWKKHCEKLEEEFPDECKAVRAELATQAKTLEEEAGPAQGKSLGEATKSAKEDTEHLGPDQKHVTHQRTRDARFDSRRQGQKTVAGTSGSRNKVSRQRRQSDEDELGS